jgi:hypothetical protein
MAQPGGPAPSGDGQGFEAAHERLLQRPDIQFEFPTLEVEPPPDPPGWLEALGRFFGAIGNAIAPFAQAIFWLAVAALVLGLIYLIAREFGWLEMSRDRRGKGAQADAYRPAPEVARALLGDADALAAAGRFEDAVHVLLLRSIEDMHRHRPRAVRPAATSRDIAGLTILPEQARGAFTAMAQLVETSLFGGRPVGAEGYDACRKAYAEFALEGVWR